VAVVTRPHQHADTTTPGLLRIWRVKKIQARHGLVPEDARQGGQDACRKILYELTPSEAIRSSSWSATDEVLISQEKIAPAGWGARRPEREIEAGLHAEPWSGSRLAAKTTPSGHRRVSYNDLVERPRETASGARFMRRQRRTSRAWSKRGPDPYRTGRLTRARREQPG